MVRLLESKSWVQDFVAVVEGKFADGHTVKKQQDRLCVTSWAIAV